MIFVLRVDTLFEAPLTKQKEQFLIFQQDKITSIGKIRRWNCSNVSAIFKNIGLHSWTHRVVWVALAGSAV